MTLRSAVLAAVVAHLVLPILPGQGIDRLWSTHCQNCHGVDGRGGGAGASSLLDEVWVGGGDDRSLYDAIAQGQADSGMPGFAETLEPRQMWALVVYLQEARERDRRQRVGSPRADGGRFRTQHHSFRIETVVAEGLETPWSLDFLPDGSGLVTEKSGRLRPLRNGRLGAPIAGTPAVRDRGQGGLLDVAVHPEYARNGWIYLSYAHGLSSTQPRPPGMTRIVRGRIRDGRWADEELIFAAREEHYLPTDLHFGCRLVWAEPAEAADRAQASGRRLLYFAIGERGRMEHAQQLDLPHGKIHRLWDDGAVPASNPFVATPRAYGSIWSYGHRNPQGLVLDRDGVLWDTEHGPRGGDELNRIERGRNYGWPLVSFGINYNGAPLRTPFPDVEGQPTEGPDALVGPVFHWTPSIAACGLDVARGPMFPAWAGDLIAGGLAGTNVDRLRVRDGRVVEREELVHGGGRVRDVVTGPEGAIYLVSNGPDRILRLVQAD